MRAEAVRRVQRGRIAAAPQMSPALQPCRLQLSDQIADSLSKAASGDRLTAVRCALKPFRHGSRPHVHRATGSIAAEFPHRSGAGSALKFFLAHETMMHGLHNTDEQRFRFGFCIAAKQFLADARAIHRKCDGLRHFRNGYFSNFFSAPQHRKFHIPRPLSVNQKAYPSV